MAVIKPTKTYAIINYRNKSELIPQNNESINQK